MKKGSVNDQSIGHFQAFISFFPSLHPKFEKLIPVNQLIKKSGLINKETL